MTPSPLPVLVEVTRGGRVESAHHGTLVVLAGDGSIRAGVGEFDAPIFARSALKPLQAAGLLGAGFAGSVQSLALACASHDGADVHRAGVHATLAAAGLTEAALRCPADLPWGAEPLAAYLAAGGRPAAVCHNCSGKHAAMLATCVINGWDVENYLDPTHQVQTAAAAAITALTATSIAATSVDGCGAPAHAVPLHGLARGFAAIAAAMDGPAGEVAAAMRANPVLVGGVGRAVTDLLAEVGGLVTKDGAEGVWAGALPDGRAFAVKIADGAARAAQAVATAVLASWGFTGPAVQRWAAAPVLGGGRPVGVVRASAQLSQRLSTGGPP